MSERPDLSIAMLREPLRIVRHFAVFDYEAQPKDDLDGCNLCGRSTEESRGPFGSDRYGYEVGWEECPCSLVYLNPRMTAEAYRQFYESGAYRRLVSAYHGREINELTIRKEQRAYAADLAQFLAPHMPSQARTLLDVGGSTGIVAGKLSMTFHLTPTVLDPAVTELGFALAERIAATAESFDPAGRKWDLITICQTIDHLLDPMGVLKKLRGCLTEDGLLFVDAVDYNVTKQIKIDHPYNFTEATMAEMLKRAGFREVARDRAPDGVHVRFLCAR